MESLGRPFRSRYFWPLFAAAVVILYLFGLTIPLLGPDEPRYAQVAREMFYRGDWVTTQLGGHNWFEKPALLYWLQIASFHAFGTNEFAARFGSALFGLGTIACIHIFGRISSRDSGNKTLANYLGMIAATSLGLIVFSRGASFDIILTFPITAAVVGFFAFDRADDEERRKQFFGLFAFYFFVGVAVLAKGLVGIVFPFAIVYFYLLLSRRLPRTQFVLSHLWGLPASLLVAAAWYLPMYLANGWEFIDEFFIQHHFQRYTSNKYLHPQPFHFFLWVLPLMTIPWLPFFFIQIWRMARNGIAGLRVQTRPEESDDSSVALTFALAWLLVPLVFFSFSGSKLPGYILPAVPSAIIIAGFAVRRFALRSMVRETLVKGVAVLTLMVVAAIIQFALPKFADADSVKRLIKEADDRGFSKAKVIGFTTVSHNAEWYAAGRLFRDGDGKQMRLNGPGDIPPLIAAGGGQPILILSRPDLLHHIANDPILRTERIADNGEFVIAAVRLGR